MPNGLAVPAAGPNATTTATYAVTQNGFPAGATVAGVTGKPNQLQVTVTKRVDNFFTSLLGYKTTTITRRAIAEFNPPIQMGSPSGHIGNDPETGATDKHWLNIGAPGVDKHTGDRFADFTNCDFNNTYKCDGSGNANSEYREGTYVFTVNVPKSGDTLDLQAYDPEYAAGNGGCDNRWLSAGQISTLNGQGYPTANGRYDGANDYCTGDDSTNLSGNSPQATAWIVRDSSKSLFDAFQNPVVGTCAHQFKGYSPTSDTYWFDLLDTKNTKGQYDADLGLSFHRWYTVCHITSAQAGKYFIQVRSNVPYDDAKRNSATYLTDPVSPLVTTIGGQNRYSIRALVNGGTPPAGYGVFAEGRLPVYTNTTGANTPNFYLARVVPAGGTSGRILALHFYDIGDIGSTNGTPVTTEITISPPLDAGGDPVTCTQWTAGISPAQDNQALPTSSQVDSANSCHVTGITDQNYDKGGNNGVLMNVRINLPPNYSCDTADATGCWIKIRMGYSASAKANDTTTWTAGIDGDPVRLIQ
jgi:hypothetical protein